MYSILTIWKERNNISFDDEKNSIHRLKHSFLCNIWTWSKLFLVFSPPSVVDFVDWLGLLWEGRCFLLPLYFGGALRQLLYMLCTLGRFVCIFCLWYSLALLIKYISWRPISLFLTILKAYLLNVCSLLMLCHHIHIWNASFILVNHTPIQCFKRLLSLKVRLWKLAMRP